MSRDAFDYVLHIYLIDRNINLTPVHRAVLYKLFLGETLTAKSNNMDMHLLLHIANKLKEVEHYAQQIPKQSKVQVTINNE